MYHGRFSAYSKYWESTIVWNAKLDADSCAQSNGEIHFSLTGEGKDVCGTLHDEFLNHFPDFEWLVRWHLFGMITGPTYYYKDAYYHFGISKYNSYNLDHFKSTILFGVVDSDEDRYHDLLHKLEDMGIQLHDNQFPKMHHATVRELVQEFLDNRFDELMNQFYADMARMYGSNGLDKLVAKRKVSINLFAQKMSRVETYFIKWDALAHRKNSGEKQTRIQILSRANKILSMYKIAARLGIEHESLDISAIVIEKANNANLTIKG